jgi:hypothetical protein
MKSPLQSTALKRSNTSMGPRPRTRSAGPTSLTRSNTSTSPASSSTAIPSRFGTHFGYLVGGYNNEALDTDHSSLNDTIEDDETESQEWGLAEGMELFEVSAKDDMGTLLVCLSYSSFLFNADVLGVPELFDSLIRAIMIRKDSIDRENELKRRDSVFLSPTPTWAAQAEEEEAREKARTSYSWNCCQT